MSVPDLELDPATEFCGTERGYQRHRRARTPACQPCLDAHSALERTRRTGSPVKRELQPCGTDAAYHRHMRHRQLPDEACRAAHATAERERRTAAYLRRGRAA